MAQSYDSNRTGDISNDDNPEYSLELYSDSQRIQVAPESPPRSILTSTPISDDVGNASLRSFFSNSKLSPIAEMSRQHSAINEGFAHTPCSNLELCAKKINEIKDMLDNIYQSSKYESNEQGQATNEFLCSLHDQIKQHLFNSK